MEPTHFTGMFAVAEILRFMAIFQVNLS